jgi:small subunit ribosomal protein S14
MSKKSVISRNLKRKVKSSVLATYRQQLKNLIRDKSLELEERFKINLKLWKLPRNSSISRVRNRDSLTGRPRGYYRYFSLDRISLRLLARNGQIPGLKKSSW